MWRCEILTSWTQVDGANVPLVAALLGPGDSCEDVTGQPAENLICTPNAAIWRVHCSAATVDVLEADPDTTVLTAEEMTDGE